MTPGFAQILDPEVEAIVAVTRSLTNQAHRLSSCIGEVLDDLTEHIAAVETGRAERRHTEVEVPSDQERRRATGQ